MVSVEWDKTKSVFDLFHLPKFAFEDFQKNYLIIESLQPYLSFLEKQSNKKHQLIQSHRSHPDRKIQSHRSDTDLKIPIVIFDIDGTLVDYYSQESIDPVVDFYKQVLKMGFHTVILTARLKDMKKSTVKLLNKIGIKKYDDIIFRDHWMDSFGKYKLDQRKKLATTYDIVANVGDMITDFQGGYNGKIIKIPS